MLSPIKNTGMISLSHYNFIKEKYGELASWAVWADEDGKPKSNIGDMSIFDLSLNPGLLSILNPGVVMVGLNFSRTKEKRIPFCNFHDKRSRGQDYKIRYAFRDTLYYGAYMTDLLKNHVEVKSEKLMALIRSDPALEREHIEIFEKEINEVASPDPLIIAFGDDTYRLLNKNLGNKFKIRKVKHYSARIGKENYRKSVLESLLTI